MLRQKLGRKGHRHREPTRGAGSGGWRPTPALSHPTAAAGSKHRAGNGGAARGPDPGPLGKNRFVCRWTRTLSFSPAHQQVAHFLQPIDNSRQGDNPSLVAVFVQIGSTIMRQ